MRITTILLILLLPALLFGGGSKELGDRRPVVAVSILPQAFFVNSIAGDHVEVVTLVGEGQNPHSYEPSPSQMALLAKASVWLLSGTDFEVALRPKVAKLYPNLKIVDTTEGMQLRLLEEDDDHDHDHQHLPSADGLNIDRHSWLGHAQSQILLSHTAKELTAIVPSYASDIARNAASLADEIDNTFALLQEELAPLKGQSVFVYHPSFGYFLDSFGMVQEAVETGGKEPTARDLQRLILLAQEKGARAIFVQKQFPASSAQRVAQPVGARVIPLDPLAYQWLENIRLMGAALKESL
ncbi:MAG: zinc ABC transporter solute-binding protein [Spirochaetales bacterium]|nr:zinc ABC transporter solute-binding protein [Spirochaetales bacterium]